MVIQLLHEGVHTVGGGFGVHVVLLEEGGGEGGSIGVILEQFPEESTGFVEGDHHIEIQITASGQNHSLTGYLPEKKTILEFHKIILSGKYFVHHSIKREKSH